MNLKKLLLYAVFILIILLTAACGPSPEEQTATAAALTAAAATDTPVPTNTPTETPVPTNTPTNTPTPTPTPVPYDLTLLVADAVGMPLENASVFFEELDETQQTGPDGRLSWSDLPGETVTLAVTAQGYLPEDAAASLERGPNEITIALERDPFGLLPTQVCASGETLIYLEDFQDGSASEWQEIEFRAQGWDLAPDPLESGDLIVSYSGTDHSFTGMNAFIVENGVWRLQLKITGSRNLALNWRVAPEPFEIEAGEVHDSRYQVIVSTGQGAHMQRVQLPASNIGAANSAFFLAQDTWYTIEISTFEGRTELWIDGQLLLGYTDPQPIPGGFIGLEVFPAEAAVVYLDDFAVCGLSAPFEPLPTGEADTEG